MDKKVTENSQIAKNVISVKSYILLDHAVFRLHYRVTAFLILVCAAIAATPFIDNTMKCVKDGEFDEDFINSYCLTHSTYTIPKAAEQRTRYRVAHPGVAPLTRKSQTVKYHRFYQWVYVVLFFQAILFYAPHFIWKSVEGGYMKRLFHLLNPEPVEAETKKDDDKDKDESDESKKPAIKLSPLKQFWSDEQFIKPFVSCLRVHLKYNQLYAYLFMLCETLNLLNIIFQVIFTDYFLGFEFATYGLRILSLMEEEPDKRVDVFEKVFPKVTKCTFNKYGPSGNIVNYDQVCLLQMNMVNEKIYAFLWFWFLFIFIVTALHLIYRICTVVFPPLRTFLTRKNCRESELIVPEVARFLRACDFGDWLILNHVRKWMTRCLYTDVVNILATGRASTKRIKVA